MRLRVCVRTCVRACVRVCVCVGTYCRREGRLLMTGPFYFSVTTMYQKPNNTSFIATYSWMPDTCKHPFDHLNLTYVM